MPTCHNGYSLHTRIRLPICSCTSSSVTSLETRSVFALRNWLLKGMGDETLIGLLHIMPKTHPLLIKRIGTTLLDHALAAATLFPVVKLAKVDSDMP